MRTQESVTSSKKSPNGFQHTNKYLLVYPFIITIDNIVEVGSIYYLLNFEKNGEIDVFKIKFLKAYVTDYRVTIVVLDTKTGEILKHSHRLDNDDLPCDWVLTDLDIEPLNNIKSRKKNSHENNK